MVRVSVSKTEGSEFESLRPCHLSRYHIMFNKVSTFVGEVKGELRKATWPWSSDPKDKGVKKYKELIDSTIVVLVAIALIAGYVAFWDVILKEAVDLVAGFVKAD